MTLYWLLTNNNRCYKLEYWNIKSKMLSKLHVSKRLSWVLKFQPPASQLDLLQFTSGVVSNNNLTSIHYMIPNLKIVHISHVSRCMRDTCHSNVNGWYQTWLIHSTVDMTTPVSTATTSTLHHTLFIVASYKLTLLYSSLLVILLLWTSRLATSSLRWGCRLWTSHLGHLMWPLT